MAINDCREEKLDLSPGGNRSCSSASDCTSLYYYLKNRLTRNIASGEGGCTCSPGSGVSLCLNSDIFAETITCYCTSRADCEEGDLCSELTPGIKQCQKCMLKVQDENTRKCLLFLHYGLGRTICLDVLCTTHDRHTFYAFPGSLAVLETTCLESARFMFVHL